MVDERDEFIMENRVAELEGALVADNDRIIELEKKLVTYAGNQQAHDVIWENQKKIESLEASIETIKVLNSVDNYTTFLELINEKFEKTESRLDSIGKALEAWIVHIEPLKSVLKELLTKREDSHDECVHQSFYTGLLEKLDKKCEAELAKTVYTARKRCSMNDSELTEQEADIFCTSYINEHKGCEGCSYYIPPKKEQSIPFDYNGIGDICGICNKVIEEGELHRKKEEKWYHLECLPFEPKEQSEFCKWYKYLEYPYYHYACTNPKKDEKATPAEHLDNLRELGKEHWTLDKPAAESDDPFECPICNKTVHSGYMLHHECFESKKQLLDEFIVALDNILWDCNKERVQEIYDHYQQQRLKVSQREAMDK